MRDRYRAVLAVLSTALLVSAWAVALVQRPAAANSPAAQPSGFAVTIPDVHIDGLTNPVASEVPAATPSPLATVPAATRTLPASQIPAVAQRAYQRSAQVLAAAKPSCHLKWPLLAAIARIESDHGRYGGNRVDAHGVSQPGVYGIALNGANKTAAIPDTDNGQWDGDDRWDRAVGPMQIIPSTWSVIAVDGDHDGVKNPQDINDASLAAGVYLCGGGHDLGTEAGERAAVYGYNHSQSYVAEVMALAHAYANGDNIAALPAAPAPIPDAGVPTRSIEADAQHRGRELDHKDKPKVKTRSVRATSPREPKGRNSDERALDQTGTPQVTAPRESDESKPRQPAPQGNVDDDQNTTVVVPDLVGSTFEDAARELDDLGLKAIKRTEASDEPKDQVRSGKPGPGTEVEPDSTVTIFVSKGPVVVTEQVCMAPDGEKVVVCEPTISDSETGLVCVLDPETRKLTRPSDPTADPGDRTCTMPE